MFWKNQDLVKHNFYDKINNFSITNPWYTAN